MNLAALFPTKVIHSDKHEANNRPFYIRISTGCDYYAAVRAQELYEGIRATAWLSGGGVIAAGIPACLTAALGAEAITTGLTSFGGFAAFTFAAGTNPYPSLDHRSRRELMGQAVENAAVKMIYQAAPEQVETNHFFNARQISYPRSSYQRKGYFPALREYPWEQMTNGEFFAGNEIPARISLAMDMLKSVEPEAEAWVAKHASLISKWRWDERSDTRRNQYHIPFWERG